MEIWLEEDAWLPLKSGNICKKQHIGNTMENEIKELDSMNGLKYLGLEKKQYKTQKWERKWFGYDTNDQARLWNNKQLI
jgi:hypothetical protein